MMEEHIVEMNDEKQNFSDTPYHHSRGNYNSQHKCFTILPGAEQVFGEICEYLEAKDLLVLSVASTFFNRISQSTNLWSRLLSSDFLHYETSVPSTLTPTRANPFSGRFSLFHRMNEDFVFHHNDNNTDPMIITQLDSTIRRDPIYYSYEQQGNYQIIHPNSTLPSKALYLQKLRERSLRIHNCKVEQQAIEAEQQRGSRSMLLQSFLDCTQMRMLIPLPLLASIISIILFGLYIDGLDISIWICAAPLLFYFLYLGFCIIVHIIVYTQQSIPDSICKGLWSNIRGPLRIVFNDLLGGSIYLTLVATLAALLCCIQVWLVALKLSSQSHLESDQQKYHVDNGVPSDVTQSLPWPLVFLPIWCLLLLYCITPAIRCINEISTFFIGLITVWIPFFIFFVCLSIKLDGQEHHSIVGSKLRLALILMPFWLLEGAVLLSSLLFVIFGIYRFRRGFLERIDEHVGIFLSLWCLIMPFVIFQALISARDDGSPKDITAMQTVVPILIIVGVFALSLLILALRVRTPFQAAREEQERAVAGSRILFQV